ncbi:hypothetical protein AURDEDRAFT_160615 [Auricularia subglabra TFB-10046 SS5]|nr:hypothetical protein AURDEDRAFT_160615 [Auricularia subglabra TFB-10046 SS5]
MPINDEDIAAFEHLGYKELIPGQFRRMAPVEFPPVIQRHTIPPIRAQLVNQTKTPLYLLGWMTTAGEFTRAYRQKDSTSGFSDVRIELSAQWVQELKGSEKDAYRNFAPDVINKGLDGDYVLHILGNYSEKHLRQALDEEFIKTAMEYLGKTEDPQWIRMQS